MSDEESDAAALRLAFNRAAETFPGSVTAFLFSRGEAGAEQARLLMDWWRQFYEALRDSEAGLKLLAEMAMAKDSP